MDLTGNQSRYSLSMGGVTETGGQKDVNNSTRGRPDRAAGGRERNMMYHSVRARKSGHNQSGFTMDAEFAACMAGCNLPRLGASRDIVFAVDKQLRLRGYNAAYARSARRLGGRRWLQRYGLGFPLLEGFTGFYAEHYERVYSRCLNEEMPYAALYGCATPKSFGWYRESVSPLAKGDGLLITHHLLELTRRSAAAVYDEKVHRGEDGLVLQCCHCERIRNYARKNHWDWLPDLPADPGLELSHGLCPHCLDTYYGDLLPDRG